MSDLDDLRADLVAARAELLATLDGLTPEEFTRAPAGEVTEDEARWPIRDVLWHVGLVEDWLRRVSGQGVEGRPIDGYNARSRPALAQDVAYLVEWLEQCRRPLLALLGRIPEDALDREFTLPEGEVRTARRLITHIARHDREHAVQIRALRGQ
jgi:uncharacterized damage-inducible protein DinB